MCFDLIDREAVPAHDVVFKGPIRGASAISNEDAIGPAINHTYTVCSLS